MENNNENNEIKIKKWTRGTRKTNYEYLKIWRERHREQYLIEKKKLNEWNKYKKIYLNILLE
jgi:hypothetical protein